MANSAIVGILRALLTANTAEFETAMKRSAESAKVWSRDLKQIGLQATQVGTALTKTLTVPLLGLATASAKAAIDFESSFAGVRKTVDATEAQFAELAQGMRNLAKEIPINVNELNKIGEAAGQLGIKTENIIGFTEVMAKLGVTTNLSADQAATSLARLANITGMQQSDFDRLGSTIVALGNHFATTESEIVDFGLRIAGAGKIAGLTEAQILAIGSAMSSVGVQAEAGGTAVQKVLNDITEAVATGNDKLAVFAKTAGLSSKAFAEAFRTDAGAAFAQFVDGLGKQGDKAFTTLDQLKLGNERVVRAFLSLANAGTLLTDNLRVAGTAWQENTALAEEARKRFETTQSQLTLLWNRVKDVGITLGNALLPAIQSTIAAVNLLLPIIDALAKAFAALPGSVQLVILGIGGLVVAIGPLLYAFGQLAISASALIGAFAKKGIAMRALNAIYAETTVAATGAAGAMTRFWTAAAGPIALLGGAVALIAALGAKLRDLAGVSEETGQRLSRMNFVYGESFKDLSKNTDQATTSTNYFAATQGMQAKIAERARLALLDQARAAKVTAEAEHQLSEEMRKRLDALGAQLSGRALQKEIDEVALAIQRLGGIEKVSAFEQQKLADSADQWLKAGAKLPPMLMDNWLAHVSLATAVGGLDRNLQNLLATGREMPGVFEAWEKAWGKDSFVAQGLNGLFKVGTGQPALGKDITEQIKRQWEVMFEELKPVAVRLHEGLLQATAGLPSVIMQALTGGGDVGKAIGGLFGGDLFGSLAGKFDAVTKKFAGGLGGLLQKALGTTIGGAIGSIIPGLGTLLGAGLGKLFGKLFGPSEAVRVNDLRDQFMEASGGLKEIHRTIAQFGNDPELLAAFNRLYFTGKEGDFKAGMEAYEKRLGELAKKLDDNLNGSGIWDTWTRNAAAAALATGEDLIGMADAIARQQGRAVASLNTLLGGFSLRLNALFPDEVIDQGLDLSTVVVDNQEEFDRLARIGLNTFNTLIASGVSAVDAIDQISPAIDALIGSAERFGFQSSEAYDILKHWSELVETNKPLLDQIAAMNELLIATANLGGLTQQAFDDMEAQGKQAFDQLIASGFTQQEALAQMAPLLDTLIQLHKDRGLAIDEETQKLIDQAREQGLLKDEGISTNDILIEGLGKLIELLGGQVPDAWREMSRGARDAIDDVAGSVDDLGRSIADLPGLPTGRIDIGYYPRPEVLDLPELAVGGIVTSRLPAVVGEAGPEAVIPLDRLSEFLRSAEGGDRPLTIHNHVYVGGTKVDDYIVETTLKKIEDNNSGGAPTSFETRFGSLVRRAL